MYLEKEQDTWHFRGCNEEKKKAGRKEGYDAETGSDL